MKAREFAAVLKAYTEMLDAPNRSALEGLASALEQTKTATAATSAQLKRFEAATAGQPDGRPTLSSLVPPLERLARLLGVAGKPAVVKDLQAVEKFLRSRPSLEVTDLFNLPTPAKAPKKATPSKSAPVRIELIDSYERNLRGAGSDASRFDAIYGEISSGVPLTSAEVIALAKRFASGSIRSRPDALKKIQNYHHQRASFGAKAAATAGRSAA